MIGNTLSHYKILSKLGQGGMGEVYLAEDSRLDRKVALKILPEHLSERADLRERFEREARAVSSNHPHICTLHDIGEQDGIHYLVMEHLEGESLADRLEKGSLPLERTLEYAIQIADALDKAHRQGVVHRDLKPGNIMLVKSGAKLLDFGLAKLKATEATEENLSALPTEQANLTAEGTILGTLQYMAPEQLEGKDTDSRTDIFAFGAVVYEMATGKKAFEGSSQASLIGAILKDDPAPMSELQPMTPSVLDWVVRRCLAKQPDERVQSASDLVAELKWIGTGQHSAPLEDTGPKKRGRLAWTMISTALFIVAVTALVLLYFESSPAEEPSIQFVLSAPAELPQSRFVATAVSPDGRQFAFAGYGEGGERALYLQALDSLTPRALPGTEGAYLPFWSPDSRSVGFFAEGKLKRIEVSGGSPETLADVGGSGRGGTWNREGVILFSDGTQIYHLPAIGGTTTPISAPDESLQENSHRWPYFLPDGEHFLYLIRSLQPEDHGIYLGSLQANDKTRVVSALSRVAYAAPGNLLFVREQTLLAQPFDADTLEIVGEPFVVAEGPIQYASGTAWANFSVSENGLLTYAYGSRTDQRRFVWVNREGEQISSLKSMGNGPTLSPDGRQVAFQRIDLRTGTSDIWLYDLSRDLESRFTVHPAYDQEPHWSPDGDRIVFSSARDGAADLYERPVIQDEEVQRLLQPDDDPSWLTNDPTDWSRDGRFIVYLRESSETRGDLWVLPVSEDEKPFAFLESEFDEIQGRISPDGRWMAYASDESGRYEIYVRSFPEGTRKRQISTNGGASPVWRSDGEELFYISLEEEMVAVPVITTPAFEAATPVILFPVGYGARQRTKHPYAVASKGQRFLLAPFDEDNAQRTIGVLNWAAGLEP